MSAREEVLSRIAAAIGAHGAGAAGPPAPAGEDGPTGTARGYPSAGGAVDDGDTARQPFGIIAGADGKPGGGSGDVRRGYRLRRESAQCDLLDLLASRLAGYRATVRRTTEGQLAATIAAALAQSGARRVVVPPGLELPALPDGVRAVADHGFSAHELDGFDGAITAVAVAVAETGTIILDGSPDQGRRAVTLVPDYHLCIVRAGQVVALVPEAIERLTPDRPLTLISGPSATSDIELERVEGVHGPRTLDVIIVEPS